MSHPRSAMRRRAVCRRPARRGRTEAASRRARRARAEPTISVSRFSKAIRVSEADVVRAARHALGSARCARLNVALVDDAAMSELHQRYMGDPRPTDVLTFDLRDAPSQAPVEGEIIISLDTALGQAGRFSADPAEEVLRYVIHGVLHLLGYDDHTPAGARRMRREENRVLAAVKVACPRPVPVRNRSTRPGSSTRRA